MKRSLLILGLCLVVSLGADDSAADRNILVVSGEGKVKVRARIADVNLGIQIEGRSAFEVQQALARLTTPVIEALRSLKADQIESSTLMITPQYNQEHSSQITGYRGQGVVRFSSGVDRAGELIDAAIQAGANQVESVALHPEPDQLLAAREQALREATAAALREARVVMEGLHLEQIGVVKVTIAPVNNFSPHYNRSASLAVPSGTTQILDEEQEVPASLTLSIEYGRLPVHTPRAVHAVK